MDYTLENHGWVRSTPTFRDDEECALCDQPRAAHEWEASER